MRKGFSLIEISVVLVIIGLLAGGILIGGGLIGTARTQKAIGDFTKYGEAATGFYEKYYYWAGDIPDATSRWSGTSNGNGDGYLGVDSSGTFAQANEFYYFWLDLAKAQYIEGSYTGAAGSVPKGAFSGSYLSHVVNNSGSDADTTRQALLLTPVAQYNETNGEDSDAGIVKGQDAQYIDSKIDDGLPRTGRVRSAGSCITSDAYEVSTSDLCEVYYFYKY